MIGLPETLDALASVLNYDALPKRAVNNSLIRTILSLVFTTTGAVSVMMVVIGGIKYASSQGDPQAISKAKNTIVYAVVGLLVSIFSLSIIGFVLGRVA
jgi:hypothetical protein